MATRARVERTPLERNRGILKVFHGQNLNVRENGMARRLGGWAFSVLLLVFKFLVFLVLLTRQCFVSQSYRHRGTKVEQ